MTKKIKNFRNTKSRDLIYGNHFRMIKIKEHCFNFIWIFLLIFFISSCKSSQVGEKVKLPCQDESVTDKNAVRGFGTYKSKDKGTAIKAAKLEAKSDLASNTNSIIDLALEKYSKEFLGSKSEDVKKKFRDWAIEYASVTLKNKKIVCQDMRYFKKSKEWEYYCTMEVFADSITAELEYNAQKLEELELDYDHEQFKKIYDEKLIEFKEERKSR